MTNIIAVLETIRDFEEWNKDALSAPTALRGFNERK